MRHRIAAATLYMVVAAGAHALAAAYESASDSPPEQPHRFAMHEIATGLRGGYQVVAADLNRDGRPDLVVVASGLPELLWFENPTWTRHVIAGGFSGLINVAVADIDGDSVPEIAVASGFSTRPDQSSGIVSLLKAGSDPRQPWTVREIDRVPTAHRLRWFRSPNGAPWLLNSPLSAATARPPNYDGATPIYRYRSPDWVREEIPSAETGVVHAIEVPYPFPLCQGGACFFSAGFAGIHRYQSSANERLTSTLISPGDLRPAPNGGSSEVGISVAVSPGPSGHDMVIDYAVIAAIEPWHGHQVVIYRRAGADRFERRVIDSTLVDGHTLITAHLDGDGGEEVIVGQRGGTRQVLIYTANRDATGWTRSVLDGSGMAAAGCTAADLNGDGRIDIACIGSATANLRWYENLGGR